MTQNIKRRKTDMCDSESIFDDICRDYKRNVCNRGKKCRFKHPAQVSINFGINMVFNAHEERIKLCRNMCHDFQNSVCNREGCKYVHCSAEDEKKFIETGSFSTLVLEDAITKSVIPSLPGEAPVCRDYLSGECRRGKTCKFRHLSHCKYRKELDLLFGVETMAPQETASVQFCEVKRMKTSCQPCTDIPCVPASCTQGYVSHDKCQAHFHMENRCSVMANLGRNACSLSYNNEPYCTEAASNHLCERSSSIGLADEVTLLKKQVLELKKQVSDLAAANEFLLDQNAALRLSRKNGGVVALQPPTPATLVTGATMNVQPAAGQLVAVSGQNASAQQLVATAVPVSIGSVSCTGAAQMTLSTGNPQQLVPVSCHALAAVSSMTVAGQTGASPALLAATVPVSQQQLVPVSVSNPASQLMSVTAVPVSLPAMSMAAVHIPPIVTAASDPPHSIAMSVPPPTSLLSYPIMTQHLLPTR